MHAFPHAHRIDLPDEALRYGTLPVVWTAADRGEALTAYAQLYLKEEIQAEALVRNLPGFARFLPVAALFHGQAMNVSGISRGDRRQKTADGIDTVPAFLAQLEDQSLFPCRSLSDALPV